MSKLTPRLSAALEYILSDSVFADIGSDHAYLAAEAVRSGKAKKAIASDIRIGPLTRSSLNTADMGGRVKCLLSDGFDDLPVEDIDCAAICGMGGETIISIISRAHGIKNMRLILQPQSNQQLLRAYLWDNGYTVLDESFAQEGIHAYCVMLAVFSGENERYSLADTYLGKIRPDCDAFRTYAARVGRYAENLQKAGFDAETQGVIDECSLICKKQHIILASASPRRSDICRRLGLDITVIPAKAEAEFDPALSAQENMLRIASSKAEEVAASYGEEIVLGADTLVLSPDGEPLGKPADEKDAFRMLQKLSGSRHRVMTGVCIIKGQTAKRFCVTSTVGFRALSDDEIAQYIATGEPFGKAGAYAIQGIGGRLVDSVEGSLTNIIGLPETETAEALLQFLK